MLEGVGLIHKRSKNRVQWRYVCIFQICSVVVVDVVADLQAMVYLTVLFILSIRGTSDGTNMKDVVSRMKTLQDETKKLREEENKLER